MDDINFDEIDLVENKFDDNEGGEVSVKVSGRVQDNLVATTNYTLLSSVIRLILRFLGINP